MTEIKITRYRPGRAIGAGDLHAWASRRLAGKSGVPNDEKRQRKKWRKFLKRQRRKKLKASLLRPVESESRLMGPPCPRCKHATAVREHPAITEKQLRQPFYYSRWYICRNPACKTTTIMPEEFRVYRDDDTRRKFEEKPEPFSDIALDVLDGIRSDQTRPP